MKTSRLLPRLSLPLLAPVVAALLLAGLVAFWRFPPLLSQTAADTLAQSAGVMASLIAKEKSADPEALQDRLVKLAEGGDLRITVIAEDGVVLGDSARTADGVAAMDNHGRRPEVVAAREGGRGSAVRRSDTTGVAYVYAAASARNPSGERLFVRVARPLAQLDVFHGRLLVALLAAGVGGGLGALSTLVWLHGRIVRPFEQIIQRAYRIAGGDLDLEIAEPENPELARLARSINNLSNRYGEQLARSAAATLRLRQILDHLELGVLVSRGEGDLFANKAFFALLGVAPTEGDPLAGLGHPVIRRLLQEAVAEGDRASERLIVRGSGEGGRRFLDLEARAVPHRGEVVLTATDVTSRLRLDSMRRDFVANVSHELKTPLSALRGYVETVMDLSMDAGGGEGDRFLSGALEQCRRLELLLSDLLTLSRIESPEVARQRSPVELGEIVREEVEAARDRARGLGIEISLEEQGQTVLEGDGELLARLVGNLLENAIAYNQEGGAVAVRLVEEECEIRLDVRDTGVGIPAEALSRIFERFYRVGTSRSRRDGGTGLGLAIVKHAAQWHGGRVEVASKVGVGSTFSVHFPRGSSRLQTG